MRTGKMERIMNRFFVLALGVALCTACNSTTRMESTRQLRETAAQPLANEAAVAQAASEACTVSEPFKSDLADTTWVPIFLEGQGEAKMPKSADEFVYMRFAPDLKVNGMSGNNLFGGSFVIGQNGSFGAVNMFSTRRMGPYGEYEYKFMQALQKADRISISSDGKKLRLMRDKEVLLDFRKIPNSTVKQ